MKTQEEFNTKPDPSYFRLSARGMVLYFLVPLPLLGFISCVALSLINDFEKASRTHCKVENYLPSISAAVGDFSPQRYIWRFCIGLHSTPRFVKALMLYNYYRSLTTASHQGLYQIVVKLALGVHMVELFSLLVLSYISSSDNYNVHETSFITFMVCSLVYMLLTCVIMKWGHAMGGMSRKVAKCFKYELTFFIINISAFVTAMYLFDRHTAYCEPLIYTWFAMMEYVGVITNICFHGSAAILFGKGSLICATFGEKLQ